MSPGVARRGAAPWPGRDSGGVVSDRAAFVVAFAICIFALYKLLRSR